MGSSRTDTGVHARQQFAHFDIDFILSEIPILVYKLNSVLPTEIALINIYAVSGDAHSRFDAIHRTYQYRIVQEKNPFTPDLSYYFRPKLDIDLMNDASYYMRKQTDFQCFSKYKTDVKTFDCNIFFACWEQKNNLVTFDIRGNRFLRGMVRAIVGTMLEIGQGRMCLDDLKQIMESKDRKNAGRAVPASGLTLVQVAYPENYFEK